MIGVPVIASGCSAWLECRVISEPYAPDTYDTCFSEVVATAAEVKIFSGGHWSIHDGNESLHTIHHLGGGNFVRDSNAFRARSS